MLSRCYTADLTKAQLDRMHTQHDSTKQLMDVAVQLAKDHYGLDVSAHLLAGEVDFNFRLTDETGVHYVLKICAPDTPQQQLDFQHDLMEYLHLQDLPFATPRTICITEGATHSETVLADGKHRKVRLLTYVDGRMLDDVSPRSRALLSDWGCTLGHLSKALADYDHPAAHRYYRWNPAETLRSRELSRYFAKAEEKATADYFWTLFENETLPQLPHLRKSVNYNDAHEHNIMVNSVAHAPKVIGIIDFGDALYCETVSEIAIAGAYAGMYQDDPLTAIAQVIKGYHSVHPLTELELSVLHSMIAARLLITVTSAARGRHEHPDHEYLSVSEAPAWRLLHQLKNIAPALAHYTYRSACGLTPVPQYDRLRQWLSDHRDGFHPLVSTMDMNCQPMDLSVGSTLLGNNSQFDNRSSFDKLISRWHEDEEIDLGYGGYLECRPVYATDAYRQMGFDGPQWRSTHLGLDLWTAAGTTVYAPYDGVIHSWANNDSERDYGPTIILAHHTPEGEEWYTLYGHLSAASLTNLTVGQPLAAGDVVGHIGHSFENGGWPPHLHFQVILDLLGSAGDFPGVCYPHETEVWKYICPDPHLVMAGLTHDEKMDHTAEHILHKRKQHLGRSLSLSYDKPLHMVRGYKQHLYDVTGRRYLDTVNNVAHVGHEHPAVVAAAQEQIAVLNTNTRYLHHHIVAYAEELLATLPPELSVVHFVNSGSEANELALRMMQTVTGQQDVIALEVGYHGNTGGTIDISSYKFDAKGGRGCPPQTHIVPMPDTYRGRHRDTKTAGAEYANYIQSTIADLKSRGRGIKGFICESVLSCGGQIPLPEGYLKTAYQYVRAAGGLCVADEVQVGFGRVGSHFWGFELQGVVPDIVTMGKPIGNGHPLAAVVTTAEVADAFANGMEYFNTYGGNPVSSAIGRAVLQVVKSESLQEHALELGHYLRTCLRQLQHSHRIIGDVRGPGLFQGIELITDQESLVPAAAQTQYLADRMRQRGYLMSTDGPLHNVIKIKPPLCITKQDITELIGQMDLVLREDVMQV